MSESRRQSRAKNSPVAADPDALLLQACVELNLPAGQVLAWKIYPDRVVILVKTGQKYTRRLKP